MANSFAASFLQASEQRERSLAATIENRIKEAAARAQQQELEAKQKRRKLYIDLSEDNARLAKEALHRKSSYKAASNQQSLIDRLTKEQQFFQESQTKREQVRQCQNSYKRDLENLEVAKKSRSNERAMTKAEKAINLKSLHVC